MPVIAGTGTNSTKESIELTIQAEEAGVDGIMLVVPYYNKPCQEGLYQHFKTIAQTTTLPVMLYNIPGRSAVNMLPETIIRLANNFEYRLSKKRAVIWKPCQKLLSILGRTFRCILVMTVYTSCTINWRHRHHFGFCTYYRQ